MPTVTMPPVLSSADHSCDFAYFRAFRSMCGSEWGWWLMVGRAVPDTRSIRRAQPDLLFAFVERQRDDRGRRRRAADVHVQRGADGRTRGGDVGHRERLLD